MKLIHIWRSNFFRSKIYALYHIWFCLLIPFLKEVGSYIEYSGISPFILAKVLQNLKHGKLILGICFQAVISVRFSWNRPTSVQSPVPPASTASGHKSFTLIGSSACREGHVIYVLHSPLAGDRFVSWRTISNEDWCWIESLRDTQWVSFLSLHGTWIQMDLGLNLKSVRY